MAKRSSWPTLGLLLASGCFYPAERGRALELRMDKLAADDAEMSGQLKAQLPKIDEKIAEVTRALNGLDQASRRSGADIGVQLQKNVEDVAQLRGQVDAYLHNIQDLDAKLTALQSSLDALKGDQSKREADSKRVARPTDKKEFFALADAKVKAGEVPLGRQLYREFVKKWPKDELTPEAFYAVGETFFADKGWDEALPEYGKVVQDFPKARSAPMALLRSADCFKMLGKATESRYALEEVLRSYPRSEAAKVAKTKLAELGKHKASAKKAAK